MKPVDIIRFARSLRKNATLAERYFWREVRNRKFYGYKFYRQYIINAGDSPYQNVYYIADFCCFSSKLIIEVDGQIHNFQKEKDQAREKALQELGYRIIRFTNEQVLDNWELVKQELLNALLGS